MKLFSNQLRLPTLLLLLTMLAALGLPAREYPLFQPKNAQNVLFDFGPVSDQATRGGSTAKLRMVDDPQEKFPFVRLEFEVPSRAASTPSYAGITFKLNDVRVTDSDVQSAILMRLRVSDPQIPMALRLRDDRGVETTIDLAQFPGVGNSAWKYFEIPVSAFDSGGRKLRPFLDSLTLLVQRPGKGTIDVALIAINAP
jgi:hypothetical protein